MKSHILTSEADFKHNFGKEPLAVGMHTSMKTYMSNFRPEQQPGKQAFVFGSEGGGRLRFGVAVQGRCSRSLTRARATRDVAATTRKPAPRKSKAQARLTQTRFQTDVGHQQEV